MSGGRAPAGALPVRAWSRLRGSLWPLPVLAVLLGLGTWQLQRLAWKSGVLAELAAAQAAPPVPAPANPAPYAPITAAGRFRPGAEAFLGIEVRGTVLGGSLIAVLDREGAPPLLVDRGWAPFEGGRVERPDGSGDLIIERFITRGAKGSTHEHDIGFFGVAAVADVERLMREVEP